MTSCRKADRPGTQEQDHQTAPHGLFLPTRGGGGGQGPFMGFRMYLMLFLFLFFFCFAFLLAQVETTASLKDTLSEPPPV